MTRLVHPDLAPARQSESRQPSPPHLGDVRELNALGLQLSNCGIQVVAHEIQLVSAGTIRRVHRHLCRWQLEDEPASAGIDMGVPEDISEERAVGFRVTAIDDDVAAGDHLTTLRGEMTQSLFGVAARHRSRSEAAIYPPGPYLPSIQVMT